jgi:hypothetical protein
MINRVTALLNSPEGQHWLNEFVTWIAEWVATAMPNELLQCIGAGGNLNTLKELWPDIVDAYFTAVSNLARQNYSLSQTTDQRATFFRNDRLACAPLVEGSVSLPIERCVSVSVGSTCFS